MTETTLIIVRHGNNFDKGDIVLRMGLQTDLPLSSTGVEQAFALGKDFKEQNIKPDIIFTTEMLRTKQTAEEFKKAFGIEIPTKILSQFNELDFGPDDGKPETEVVARLGQEALNAWEEHRIVPDGWIVDVDALTKAWQDFGDWVVREYPGKTVMLVMHGGIARFSSILTENKPETESKAGGKLSTCAYGRLVHDGSDWTCLEWNKRVEQKPALTPTQPALKPQ